MAYKSHVWRWLGVLCLGVVIFCSPAIISVAQNQQAQPTFPGVHHEAAGPEEVWEQQQRKEMEKKANLQRQSDIRKDTAKLLELATELKQSVDKSNENMLSLDVIKKAEQIEKLAKTVKDKMKGP